MNKTILVSGVSRGLGLCIAETLLNSGHKVYGFSRKKSEATEKLISDSNGLFEYREIDLSDPNTIKKAIFLDWGLMDVPLDAFINNAAVAYDDIVTNLRLNDLEGMFRINVFSPMMITKNVLRSFLLHNRNGSIIHVSSISVHTGYKGLSMYAASKGALEAFSKNTAREWGERGIRSNCIVAGFMETDMSGSLTLDQKDRIYKRTSLKKPTDVLSVAETARFLIEDGSASLTGQNLFVDSGTI
jgi:3-oxoacyl-[acyl-carrier protein] reductase